MLSDEEKKAIEYLKKEYEKLMKEDNILFPLYKSYAKRLIDIIEKQSKEIEELKKPKYVINFETNEITKLTNDFVSKDKIKAKIEPVLKQLERKMQEEYNKYGNSGEYQDIVDAYNFLESLLEKENKNGK